MKPIFIIASLALLASPAFAQQMIGPAFNLTPEIRAIWAEQSRKIEAEIARDALIRKCGSRPACIAAGEKK